MPSSPSSPLFWLWLAILLWPVLWLSILGHEAGHVLAGRLAGYYVGAWGLGTGTPLLVLPPRAHRAQTRFFLCRQEPFNGFTGAIFPGLFPTSKQTATLLLGGITANFVAFLGGILLTRASLPVGLVVAVVNGLLCLMAMVPRGGGLPSDGARLLGLLAPRGTRLPTLLPRAALGHRSLWQAVGAPVLVRFSTLSAAAAAIELGDEETTDLYLHQADAWQTPSLPALDAYAALIHGLRDEAAGSWATARDHFAHAQAGFEAQGYQAAAHLARVYGAGQDVSALKALYGDVLVHRFPALGSLAAGRVLAAVCADAVPNADALTTALSRFQNARLAWREDAQDARLFAVAADAIARSSDAAGAVPLREQAQAARARVEFALADEPQLLAAYRKHVAQKSPAVTSKQVS